MNIKNLIVSTNLRIGNHNFGSNNKNYRKLSILELIKKIFPGKINLNINTVLCGLPRSGTHWVRNVVEKSANVECTSLHELNIDASHNNDIELLKIHARSPLHLKLKMFFYLPKHKYNKKVIYIYRDPRDAIISLYNMYKSLINKKISQKEFLLNYDPIGQFKWELNSWVIKSTYRNILTIKFEDLKLNSNETFRSIFNYIDLPENINLIGIDDLVGIVKDDKRQKGTVYGWRKNYIEYKVLIDQVNDKLKNEIYKLDYDK